MKEAIDTFSETFSVLVKFHEPTALDPLSHYRQCVSHTICAHVRQPGKVGVGRTPRSGMSGTQPRISENFAAHL